MCFVLPRDPVLTPSMIISLFPWRPHGRAELADEPSTQAIGGCPRVLLFCCLLLPVKKRRLPPISHGVTRRLEAGHAGIAPAPAFLPDPAKIYTLAELVNIAEQNNPATRGWPGRTPRRGPPIWASPKRLFTRRWPPWRWPTAAGWISSSTPDWIRQTTGTFSPTLSLDYIIFDFGRRLQEIAISRSNLLAANFLFNDTHRKIIFQVMEAYYRVLNSKGQEEAQEANLKNAQTVQDAAEARLQEGLATLPDVLEARSATAQADYDLQAAIGATEIAHGDLANALGISPTSQFQVESIQDLTIPQELDDTVEKSIDRALAQRPDLMQQVEQLRAAGSEIKVGKTAYLPTLSFDGYGGLSHTYGQQGPMPGVYSPNQETWDARLSLTWNLFDGFARENRLARAKADQKQAQAQVDTIRDQVENQVWAAYSTARTALREQKAAAALLAAATRVLQRSIAVVQLRRAQPDRRGLGAAHTGGRPHRRCDARARNC